MDTPEDAERACLIVHGVERRDAVKALGLGGCVEVAQISDHKLEVTQPLARGLLTGIRDRLLGKIHPGESTVRVEFGQPVHDTAASTPDIEDADASRKPVGQAWDEWQDVRLQGREYGLPAILRHHGMEARIPGIRHAS